MVALSELFPPDLLPAEPGDRVLLVEFVNAEMFPGGTFYSFPFFLGAFDLAGVPARQLRYGVSAENQAMHDRDELTLADEDLAHLLRHVREMDATLVMLTHPIAPEQADAIRKATPGVRSGVRVGHASRILTADANRLLDRDDFRPSHLWTKGNQWADAPPTRHADILMDRFCYHDVDVRRNRFYDGLELSPETLHYGCSFCGAATAGHFPRGCRPSYETSRIDRLRKQFESIARAKAAGIKLDGLLFQSLEGIPGLGALRQAMEDAGLRGVRAMFGARTDQFLRLEPSLRAFLESVEGSDFQVAIYVVGLESFDAELLERFNKGTTPEQNIRAIRGIRELERRFPRNFVCAEYLPWCVIFFTPWTTVASLRHDLEVIRELGIQSEMGNIFRSRLRLHDDKAILALARQDGVLLDAPESRFDQLNRFKMFPHEVAWRFRDPRMKLLSAIATRMIATPTFASDELYQQLQAIVERRLFGRDGDADQGTRVDFYYHVVAALDDGEETEPVGRLLGAAFARWRAEYEPFRPAYTPTYEPGAGDGEGSDADDTADEPDSPAPSWVVGGPRARDRMARLLAVRAAAHDAERVAHTALTDVLWSSDATIVADLSGPNELRLRIVFEEPTGRRYFFESDEIAFSYILDESQPIDRTRLAAWLRRVGRRVRARPAVELAAWLDELEDHERYDAPPAFPMGTEVS